MRRKDREDAAQIFLTALREIQNKRYPAAPIPPEEYVLAHAISYITYPYETRVWESAAPEINT